MSQYTFLFFCTQLYIVLFVVAVFSFFFFFFFFGEGGREGRGGQDDRGLKKNDFLYFYYVFSFCHF